MEGSVSNIVLLCEGCGGERYSAVRFRYGIVGVPPSSASAGRSSSSRINSTLQRRTSRPKHAPQRSTASGFANARPVPAPSPRFRVRRWGPHLRSRSPTAPLGQRWWPARSDRLYSCGP
jgi:hypothetical protein